MAEIIKELTNAAVTEANLSNDGSSLAVFTNDANTTRVVREVQVQESDIASTDAKFSIDGTIVGDTFEDSSGTLVVPPSKSFDIKLNTPVVSATKSSLTLRHTQYIGNSQTNFTPITGYEVTGSSDSRFPYDFSTANLNTTTTTGTAEDIIPPLDTSQLHGNSNSNRFYAFKVPNEKIWYHIYMDSNSTFIFYKTNYTGTGEPGDTTGSTVQIESRSYGGGAFDWKNNKLYYKAGSEIKEFDLTKAGGLTISDSTQHDLFFSTQSSYGTGAICNNHYFYSYNNNVYIRNLAVASGYGTLQMSGNTSYSRVVALYNEDEDKFYVIQGYNDRANAFFKSFPAAQTADAVSFGTVQNVTTISTNFNTYMSSITGGSNYNHPTYIIEPLDTNLVSIPYSDNETRLYKAENDGLTYTGTSITVTGGFTTATQWRGVVPVGAVNETETVLPYSNYSLSTKVRTQGVEIT